MKRIRYILLLTTLLALFSGCGSKEVPGTLMEYDVEGHLYYYELLDMDYCDINCSFDHNWDGEANTDTVDVTVNVVYPYATDIVGVGSSQPNFVGSNGPIIVGNPRAKF